METEVAVECSGQSRYFYDQVVGSVKAIRVINPSRFRVIAESVKKTDKEDARVIARFLSKGVELPEVRVGSREMRELRSMIETRDKLVKMRVQLKNKIHSLLSEHGIKTRRKEFTSEKGLMKVLSYEVSESARFELEIIIEQIKSLNEGIRKIEEEIKRRGEKLKGRDQLRSIKGIGDLGATIILASIEDVNDFEDEKKLMSYAGLVPAIRESGDKQHTGSTRHRGYKILKTTLVQLGFVVIRYSDRLNSFYLSIKRRKGSAKAIIAVARKLLGIIYHLLKTGERYKEMGAVGMNSERYVLKGA